MQALALSRSMRRIWPNSPKAPWMSCADRIHARLPHTVQIHKALELGSHMAKTCDQSLIKTGIGCVAVALFFY